MDDGLAVFLLSDLDGAFDCWRLGFRDFDNVSQPSFGRGILLAGRSFCPAAQCQEPDLQVRGRVILVTERSQVQHCRVIYCFDTSAINRLLDDPDHEAIVTALTSTGTVRITAFNVIEAAKTPEGQRRPALLGMMRRLADDKRPLDRPNTIVMSVVRAFRSGARTMQVNRDEGLEGLWIALNQPELVDAESRQELKDFASTWDQSFADIVAGDRDAYQDLVNTPAADVPATPPQTIRRFFQEDDYMRRLARGIYERAGGGSLTDDECTRLLSEATLRLYLGAHWYALHRRSILRQGYSKHRNASGLDLAQAVYLQMCDRFVTNDQPQYRALRLLNKLNTKRKTMVLRYESFRRRLFPIAARAASME